MAGGGDVVIIGGNNRVRDGRASVTNRELHVRLGAAAVNVNVLVLPTPVATTDIPVRSTSSLFTAEVIDGTPLTADSPTIDVSAARWGLILFEISVVGAPTNIVLVPQFSPDSGVTWFDYRIDQWVDMRFIPAQMPVTEAIPFNYVMGDTFRLHVITVGTGVGATFTIDADLQICN